jgi:hypothetical protein
MATSTRIDVQRSDVCLDELIALYRTVHERQGKDAGVERERQLMGMAMLCRSDGLLMGYRSCSEDRLVGLTMLLTAGDRVNNILTMSAPSTRELGLTSRITADALRWSAEQGYEIFDFNGANTFSRAVDKALYHAEEKLYFRFDIEHQTSPRTYL